MTGSMAPAPPPRPPLPEWLVPWVASLLLHLLVLGFAALWFAGKREIVWVDLMETRMVRRQVTQPATEPAPPARVTPPPTPPAQPATSVHQAESAPAVTVSGEAEPVPSTPAAHQAPSPPPVPASVPGQMAPSPAPAATVETGQQRYLREQYAYIREQVTACLVYPPQARRLGWGGQVTVAFTVRADGSVEGLAIVTSSGRTILDRQALRAVEAAAPFPAPPAPALISLPVSFAIAEGSP